MKHDIFRCFEQEKKASGKHKTFLVFFSDGKIASVMSESKKDKKRFFRISIIRVEPMISKF
jgi:hypothetical protein